jgi:hypothetical protein
MGKRKIIVKQSVADSIAKVSWFIESKGLIDTAEKYADAIYDFFDYMADDRKVYSLCRDKQRALLGYKCISYRRKYTVVFIETDEEIIVCEFSPSKLIHW